MKTSLSISSALESGYGGRGKRVNEKHLRAADMVRVVFKCLVDAANCKFVTFDFIYRVEKNGLQNIA